VAPFIFGRGVYVPTGEIKRFEPHFDFRQNATCLRLPVCFGEGITQKGLGVMLLATETFKPVPLRCTQNDVDHLSFLSKSNPNTAISDVRPSIPV